MLALNDYISFQNFNWLLLLFGLIFWLLITYITYNYKPKFIFFKSILWLLVIGSLGIILWQPNFTTEVKANKVTLLTTKQAVQKFEEVEAKSNNTFVLSRLNIESKFNEVLSLNHLLNKKKQVAAVEVVGNGLTIKEFKNLPELPIKFNLLEENTTPEPFEINAPKTVFVGELFSVNLSISNDTIVHFYNSGFDTDTIKLENNKIKIEHKLATAGKHLLKINLYNNEKKLEDVVVIPIDVIEKTKANILMLNGAPFFEHQHLRDFIGKQSHRLWVRTQTSNKKYRYDYINIDQEKNIELNKQFLKQIDLLIIDGTALKALNNAEYKAIKRRRKNGMGILLRVDDQYELAVNNWEELKLGIKRTANSNRSFVTVNKAGKPVEVEVFPFQNGLLSTKLFVGEGAGKILSNNKNKYKPFCITNIKNSYLFNLKGDSIVYKWLWKNIIDASIPQKNKTQNVWQLKNDLVSVEDDYIEIELIANETEPEAYLKTPDGDWLRLSLKQSYVNNELYETTFWPDKSGWYDFKTSIDSVSQQLYIAGENENILARKNQEEVRKRQLMRHHNFNVNKPGFNKITKTRKPIPLFWNWLVFILSLSLIWILEKFL